MQEKLQKERNTNWTLDLIHPSYIYQRIQLRFCTFLRDQVYATCAVSEDL